MTYGREDKKIRICLAGSAGGHLEQILMLVPLLESFDGFLVTEKTAYRQKPVSGSERAYYVPQVNRREITCGLKMIGIAIASFRIFLKERPDVVISTGALAMIPVCLLAKLFRKKLVFIESIAKVTSPTMTGRFLYRFADRFYVQWESMKEFYPEAICLGGLY